MCYYKLCGVCTKVWKEFSFAMCTEHGDTGHYFWNICTQLPDWSWSGVTIHCFRCLEFCQTLVGSEVLVMTGGHFSFLSVNNYSCNFQYFSDVTVLIKQLCYLYCLELLVVWNQNFTATSSIFCIYWQFLAKFFLNNTIYFIVSVCNCLCQLWTPTFLWKWNQIFCCFSACLYFYSSGISSTHTHTHM
jgi:hypothetical protein